MREDEGTLCLVMLVSAATVFDLWAVRKQRQTLTSAIWKLNKTRGRYALIVAWCGLTYHLLVEQHWKAWRMADAAETFVLVG